MESRLLEHKMKTMLVWKHWRMLLNTRNPSCSSADWPEISNEHVHYTTTKHFQVGGTEMPPGSAPTPEMGAVLASVLSWDEPHDPALGFELMHTIPVGSKSRRSWCTAQTSLCQWAWITTLLFVLFPSLPGADVEDTGLTLKQPPNCPEHELMVTRWAIISFWICSFWKDLIFPLRQCILKNKGEVAHGCECYKNCKQKIYWWCLT